MSGIVFAVFTVLAAVFSYQLNKVLYTSSAPASLFVYSVLVAMLPFLLAAVISFVVAFVISSAAKSEDEEEPEAEEKKTEVTGGKTESDIEDVFKETPT